VLHVLFIDDDLSVLAATSALAERNGYATLRFPTGEAAIEGTRGQKVDAAIVDVRLPGMSGLDTARRLRANHLSLQVLLVSGWPLEGAAAQAVAAGEFPFLAKPFRWPALAEWIKRMLTVPVRDGRSNPDSYPEIVGESEPMRAVFAAMARVAPTRMPVLIVGETGTGKELVARALHRTSNAQAGPLVPVNCGAVPATLFEAECFGYEAGAFTDAKVRHRGWFEQAHKGTLFLDEIGEMPLETQVKLLRAIENQTVVPLGSTRPSYVDVRIVAATNAPLNAAVAAGTFRRDLFYRLAVAVLRLPPLRDRGADLTLLARHWLATNSSPRPTPLELSSQSLEALWAHDWPGNVRELGNVLMHACLQATGPVIQATDLPLLGGADIHLDESVSRSAMVGIPLTEASRMTAERFERRRILDALAECEGNRTEAARRLGINRRTLFDKMRRYAIPLFRK
jgi:two-component system response regulator HydG